MTKIANEVVSVPLESEMKQSYLDYAMSVIVGRALPDVRDGLKPVHRRVLFAMYELNNDWNKAYKKSARIVGDVIGKYHPHGDTAVYDTIVRMAQVFSLRYPLVDGQGNFGSVDGDSAAAMRYTEIRMKKLAHHLLLDIDKETVNFAPNYDGTEQIPVVLPARVPNLLVNGASGIAVGMATNIPPHNLTEVVNGCLAMLDNKDITIDELMQIIPGPDFPTAGIINGKAGILQAYHTGQGRIYVRAKADVESRKDSNKEAIIVHELPYQVNKARLIEKIAEHVKNKKIEGISELRDESDKDGMRIVMELRRGENAQVILNNLYAQTQMESVFGINTVALVDGRPRILNLQQLLELFIKHRREVVTRRTAYELRKAKERGHILEGLAVALTSIDPVVQLIKKSATAADAKVSLISCGWQAEYIKAMAKNANPNLCRPMDLPPEYGLQEDQLYYLSPVQAQAILDMRLHRLTGLEHDKLIKEYHELLDKIQELSLILVDPERLREVVREELEEAKQEFGDARRTEIISSRRDLTVEDLIDEEEMVVTLSHEGYIKTTPLSTYQAQHRGGRGKAAISVKEQDYVAYLLVANTHDQILCFSSIGKVYWLKVYQIPVGGRTSRGKPVVNILNLDKNESITAILKVSEYLEGQYVFMATERGTVKKTPLVQFSRQRSNGLIALALNSDDRLVGVQITDGEAQVMLFSSAGKAIRFEEKNVRSMGRTARGVRGMRLQKNQKVIALIIPLPDAQILTASEFGFGKRTHVDEFRIIGRGGQGVIAMQCTKRNGLLVGAVQTQCGEEVIFISDQGTLVRTRVDEVSSLSRNTQGVTLIRVSDGEKLVGVARVQMVSEEEIDVVDDELDDLDKQLDEIVT